MLSYLGAQQQKQGQSDSNLNRIGKDGTVAVGVGKGVQTFPHSKQEVSSVSEICGWWDWKLQIYPVASLIGVLRPPEVNSGTSAPEVIYSSHGKAK